VSRNNELIVNQADSRINGFLGITQVHRVWFSNWQQLRQSNRPFPLFSAKEGKIFAWNRPTPEFTSLLVVPKKPNLGKLFSIKPRQLRKPNDSCVRVSCQVSPQ
jgi:hypothetical protein